MMRTLLLLISLAACSSSTPGSSRSPSEQACIDTADAVAKAAQRCGQDYKRNYDEFIRVAAAGNCANIVQVRDEASLRSTCLPSMTTIACEDLSAGKIDDACKGQLLRRQGYMPELVPASGYGDFASEE
jgi:hypothetical protein